VVIFEWCRYATVVVDIADVVEYIPVVSSGDYGFAVRLIMDISLVETESKLQANLGIGQIAGALSAGNAQVNVRFAVLGISQSLIPDKVYRIDSAADLFDTLNDFHTRVRSVSEMWQKSCASDLKRTFD
jgi:hypothetical protein